MTISWSNGATGAELSTIAYAAGMPGGAHVVTIGIAPFAYSTILGWCYYGEKSIEYLFGVKSILPYRLVFIAFIGVSAMSKLIGLIFLPLVIVQETIKYFQK